jgi:hypothetical protein
MTRSTLFVLLACVFAAFLVVPAIAADPVVKKSVITEDEGTTALKISVSAANKPIYGITITDDTGSITNIVVPKGWVGISSGDRVILRSGDPISSGETVAFRILTTNKSAPLGITFRDVKSPIHSRQTL